jgi:hypothetical protein
MLNNSNFSNQLGSESVDFEKPLEIEPWMTSEDYFGISKAIAANEPALKVESWMLDNKNFSSNLIPAETIGNEPMQLEAWMIDKQYWGF